MNSFCLLFTVLSLSLSSFTPPADHPRILVQKADIPAVRERMKRPDAQATLQRMRQIAVPLTSEEKQRINWKKSDSWMMMRGVTMQSELDALNFLLYGDAKAGKRAVASMLDTLKTARFGTENDMTRPCGEMMFVGALVYDWCFPLLTEIQKKEYVEQIVRCAEMMECGWPFRKGLYICGHYSEKMIMRDFLAAGLAIYDEYPKMLDETMDLLESKFFPGRNYVFQGSGSHQGTAYISPRLIGDFSCQWLLEKAGGGKVFDDHLGTVIYDMIYRRFGNDLILPAGDCYNYDNPDYSNISMLSSSYFKDPYIAYEYARKSKISAHMLIFDLLCRDYDLEMKAPDSLPLTRYFGSPTGSMISRTGWGKDAAVVEMRMIERFVGNHQHLDAGTFYIYYKEPLALDSGFYASYNDPHNTYYSKRTIAHNGLLIYDPDEEFGGRFGNDGGQRVPDYGHQCPDLEHLLTDDYLFGKTLSHWNDGDFSLLKCDITPAYRSSKAKDVRRSFVYMDMHDKTRPAALVVYDHVVSTNPDFKKFFLLHTQDEPLVKGNVSTAYAGEGMLRCTTLLPSAASISTVGGPGKEFWVFGKNYEDPTKKSIPDHVGHWRLEICPQAAAAEDCFLNVMQVADRGAKTGKVTRVDGDLVVGAAFDGRVVLFSRSGAFLDSTFDFTVPGGSYEKMLLTDLAPGKWRVTFPDGKKTMTYDVAENEGCAIVSAVKRGRYHVRRLSD